MPRFPWCCAKWRTGLRFKKVSLALSAAQMLFEQGIGVRVVNLPCLEWFEEQSQEYRDSVLPPQVRARVSVEAGVAMPWYRYLGSAGRALSIEDFGVPLGGAAAFQHFGFTPENLVALAKESLEAAQERVKGQIVCLGG